MPRVGKSMDRKRHLRRTARELAELSKPTDAELRAQHTCMKTMSSTTCTACNRGVPYPHPTTAEIESSIRGDQPAPNVDLTDAQISTIGLVDLRVAYRQLRDRQNARAKGTR